MLEYLLVSARRISSTFNAPGRRRTAISRQAPHLHVPDRHNSQGQTTDDAQVAEDLLRAALSPLGNNFKFPRPKPSPDNLVPSEGIAERSKPAALPQTPNAQRRRFSVGLGALVVAYITFPTLIVLIGVGTYHLSTGLKQHKPASLATVADPALSLTEERDHDRRLVAENTGTQHQPQASPAAQSRLLNPTADDLSSSATKDHPFVMALPESQDGPVSPSTEGTSPKPPLSRSAPELAPPQDAKLEPTLRTQSPAETNPPAAPIVATAQLAEADPVLAAATVPIETKLPALIEARQPGFSAPKQDTQEFREQGEALLASGDIVSARRFFEYAANRGDTAAATQAGKTYDPYFLRRAGARGIPGDSDKATYWYRQAAGNGDPEAAANLKRLLNQRR